MSLPVTCIIPCHNNNGTLARAIESALKQCDEVVVVDDASTTGDPLNFAYEKFNHYALGLVSTETPMPSGVCYARNTGIDFANNGLILPLDADDTLVEGAVQKLKDAYKPGHFVYGNWYEVKDNQSTEQRPPPFTMIHSKNIGYATFLFHTDDWMKAGGYRPEFNIGGEHWGFMAALKWKAKAEPLYIDEFIFNYNRQHNKRYGRANRFHDTIKAMVGEVIRGTA